MKPPNPLTHLSVLNTMLYAPRMFDIFDAKIRFQIIHESSPNGVGPCDRNPPISHTKGGSQVCKRCQNPDAAWDGARQIAVYKFSASNIQMWVVSV